MKAKLTNEEKKSVRFSLIVRPRIARGVEALAKIQHVSTNELITQVLDSVVAQNGDVINRYNAAMTDFQNEVNLRVDS